MRHLILKIKESGMPYKCGRIMSGNSNVNAAWTSEEGEQFEYMYRLFFF